MILDALGRLMNGGFQIRDYQYTGFGSIYFFDFILLYRFIGLRRFLNVEYDRAITRRVRFNKPFDQVEIRVDPVGDVIPDLSRDVRHILWLDYDDRLLQSMLEDCSAAAYQLPPGSVLLVTVDAEPPPGTSSPEGRAEYFKDQAGEFLPYDFGLEWCALSRLARTNLQILENSIRSGLAPRVDVDFLPLFKFGYADGHEMVTLGGMIGTNQDRRRLDGCDWGGAQYARRNSKSDIYRIEVPRLTRKERLFLDSHMPSSDSWTPAEFELNSEVVEAYRNIHRYYPHYAELLA